MRNQTNSSSLTTSPARSKKDDELPLTPSFMKKPIRPDTASRLKKMFASRGSIPVVQSPKKVATINKKPDFLLQAQEEAEQGMRFNTEKFMLLSLITC